MKKVLLSFAIATMGLSGIGYAQTIWSDNIATAVPPALPTGWTSDCPGHGGAQGWYSATSATAGSTWASLTGYYNIPSAGTFLAVDDAQYPTQPHDTVMSPTFSMVGTFAHPWLTFSSFFYNATNNSSGITEVGLVLGSSNGGSTWTILDTIPGYAWYYSTFYPNHVDVSSLTGNNCKLAFTYTDWSGTADGALLGIAVKGMSIVNLTADSVGVTALNYNSIQNNISINGATLSFTATNYGIPVTTMMAAYSINGGTPVTQTFTPSGSFNPYTSQTFTFTTGMTGMVSTMTNTVSVVIATVNGVTNADLTPMQSTFVLASSSGPRAAMVEEFTSSTCPPCMEFAASFDPLCNSLNADQPASNFNIIKYQMNWPDRDNDRSYNNDGLDRRTYYNVSGIPEHFVNGAVDNYNWSYPFNSADDAYFTNEFTVSAVANKSFMDISATYAVDTIKKKLYMTVKVTPHFTKTGTYHVYIAACDQHYQNIDNEWGMLDYYNVMRQMFPDGNGNAVTSWTDGTTITFYDTAKAYTSTNWVPASTTPADSSLYPVQMDNEFWANPLLSSELIAFVEQDGVQSIMQSIVALPTNHNKLSVNTLSNVLGMNIYPNPASNEANLWFNLFQDGNVNVKVMDYAGHIVSEVFDGNMTIGAQKVVIPTGTLANGNYLVVVTTAGGSNAQRLTVKN
jgi:thiol-disulfide isomerase/thioredoxin